MYQQATGAFILLFFVVLRAAVILEQQASPDGGAPLGVSIWGNCCVRKQRIKLNIYSCANGFLQAELPFVSPIHFISLLGLLKNVAGAKRDF